MVKYTKIILTLLPISVLWVASVDRLYSQGTSTENINPIDLNNQNRDRRPTLLLPNNSSLLSGKSKSPFLLPKPEVTLETPKLDMADSEKFIDPGQQVLRRLNKSYSTNQNEDKSIMSRVDLFLGDIRDNGKYVQIALRDHEYPDGDLIRVLVNDVEVFPQILLHERYSILQVKLSPGFNKLDFVALNQGASGPNTAEIKVYNDRGNLVGNDRWYMATGVKATYLVVKE